MKRQSLLFLILAALFPAGHNARAGEASRPTAAFIHVERSPVGPLLEQILLRSDKVAWLERNEIDPLLRERKLTSLLAPAAGPQRSAIGKLLKADLLVLLRHVEQPKEHVQLVVCETRHGLRLGVHRAVLSANTQADLKQLSTLVEQALENRGREIREIVAIPPFVCNDLGYGNEHLQAAYARLAEQTVCDRPGLLCVELEEAQAIAREVLLGNEEIRRELPLYLLGEFRHEGNGDDRTVTLAVKVVRGRQELAGRRKTGLSSEDAGRFVRKAARQLIDETVGGHKRPPDSALEARQLAARAETFHTLGSWDEAAALAEASLLLDNRQRRMREVAASSLASMATKLAEWRNGPEVVARGIHCYFRAIEHFEMLLPQVKESIGKHELLPLQRHLRGAVNWANLLNVHNDRPDVQRVAAQLRKREEELLMNIMLARCRAQTGDQNVFFHWVKRGRSLQGEFDIRLRAVRAVEHLPDAQEIILGLTLHGYTPAAALNHPEGRQYLKQLAALESEAARRAAVELQRRLDEYLAARTKPPSKTASTEAVAVGRPRIRFEPIPVRFSAEPGRPDLASCFDGWIPAGEGTDFVWQGWNLLYVMNGPGQPRRILRSWYVRDSETGVTEADYDGRFVWVTTHTRRGNPRLWVIRWQEERMWEIDADDGLPVVPAETIPSRNVEPRLWIEPLAPGKVLLVSWFGRTAISTVTFDPHKGAEVDVFFEARHRHDPTEKEPWRDLQMAFQPGYIIGFRGTDGQGRPVHKVMVGGHAQVEQHGRRDRPLVVDVNSKRVEMLPHSLTSDIDTGRIAFEPDAIYRVQGYFGESRLERIGLPDFKLETLVAGVPEGYCLKFGDKFVILGTRCWLVDPAAPVEKRTRVVAARPPWKHRNVTSSGIEFAGGERETPKEIQAATLKGIYRSNLFGLLAVRQGRPYGTEFLRIVFDQ